MHIISPLAEDLFAPNYARCWLTVTGFHPYNHKTIWSCEQCEFTWQIEEFISPISQDLWSLNLVGWWLQGRHSEHKCLSYYELTVSFSIRSNAGDDIYFKNDFVARPHFAHQVWSITIHVKFNQNFMPRRQC